MAVPVLCPKWSLSKKITETDQQLGGVVEFLFRRGGVNEKDIHLVGGGDFRRVVHRCTDHGIDGRSIQWLSPFSAKYLSSNGTIVVDSNGNDIPVIIFWDANFPMSNQTPFL